MTLNDTSLIIYQETYIFTGALMQRMMDTCGCVQPYSIQEDTVISIEVTGHMPNVKLLRLSSTGSTESQE